MSYETCAYKMKRNFYEKGDYVCIRKHLNIVDWDKILSEKNTHQQYDTLIDIMKILMLDFLKSYQTILE